MYDEFERAVTGKSREGLSFLGWMSIALGTLFVVGIVGVAMAAVHIKSQVVHIAHEVAHELEAGPARAAQEMVHRFESHTDLLSATPEEGVMMLQNLDSGSPAEAFMEDFFSGSMEIFDDAQDMKFDLQGNEDGGFLDIKSDDGNVRMDLERHDGGASLVIDSEDGQVRFDLKKTDDGGFLSIDSEDGQVRFDLIKGDDGGSLVINSEDGEVRFDVKGSDTGGSLVIQTPEESFRFGAGDNAEAMPGWVPRAEWMPINPQGVYSLDSEEGSLGAVAWEGDVSAEEILGFYKSWLEGEGYELSSETRLHDQGSSQGSLWARNEADGRMVFVATEEMDGQTKILLGYGEGNE
jgi:hypothetical protein